MELVIFFRLVTFILHVTQIFYWKKAQDKADVVNPRTRESKPFYYIFVPGNSEKITYFVFQIILLLQLMGVVIFEFDYTLFNIRLFGFILVLIGFTILIAARRQLGTNWSAGYDYQIRQKQELVSHGIYTYIRHPIYIGFVIFVLGAELVIGSYLYLLAFLCIPRFYLQAKKEERILEEKFGDEYRRYRQKTKMFIPFVF